MLENSTPYSPYMIENIYPYSIEVPETITRINREITRNATLLIRLIKLIQEDDTPISDSEYTIKRITVKLRNQLELLEIHYKTDQEEYESICAELEKAVTERETLHLQNRLNDIHMEEYSIRLSVANWSIEDLSAKKRDLENCLKAMKNLKGLQAHGDIEDLYRISKNSYQSLNRLMIEPDTLKMLTQTLSKILDTIKYPIPSTL